MNRIAELLRALPRERARQIIITIFHALNRPGLTEREREHLERRRRELMRAVGRRVA